MKTKPLAAALIGAGALLSGCATANPYPPVPPPRAEVRPNPPVTAEPLLWEPGHWNWAGSGYVWEPGRYVPRDHHGDMFQPGYWMLNSQSVWTWQPAHWL